MTAKALTFDTGGTILDWHRGIRAAFAEVGAARNIKADWTAIANEYRRRSLRGVVNAERPSYTIDDVHRAKLDEVIAGVKFVDGVRAQARTKQIRSVQQAAA